MPKHVLDLCTYSLELLLVSDMQTVPEPDVYCFLSYCLDGFFALIRQCTTSDTLEQALMSPTLT